VSSLRNVRCLVLVPCVLLAPAGAAAASLETCDEVAETCLENCHVDYGMEKMRQELTKCIESCQRRRESCADLRQEQRRNQFRLEDEAGSYTPRRGDPVDVSHPEETRDPNVRPAPYEDFDDRDRQEEPRPRPKKAARGGDADEEQQGRVERARGEDPEADEQRRQARIERARQNDPDADNPPVKKKSDDSKPKKPDLSGDDWAKE